MPRGYSHLCQCFGSQVGKSLAKMCLLYLHLPAFSLVFLIYLGTIAWHLSNDSSLERAPSLLLAFRRFRYLVMESLGGKMENAS